MLVDSQQSTRWIHGIVFHRENWEKQNDDLTKEQIMDITCIIVKRFYFDEN